MTYAETLPSWFLLNFKVVQVTQTYSSQRKTNYVIANRQRKVNVTTGTLQQREPWKQPTKPAKQSFTPTLPAVLTGNSFYPLQSLQSEQETIDLSRTPF